MNKLKEINGKFYQEVEVVMLATDKTATDKPFTVGITLCNDCKLRIGNPVGKLESRQELYFLSNEEIKEGDYVIDSMGELFGPYEKGDIIGKEAKKITAATDIPLQLPQPSKSFIQAYIKTYNEGKPITKVLVEMFDNGEEDWIGDDNNGEPFWNSKFELKVNSSNEITIKKVKDSWTREEVIDLLEEYRIHLDDFPSVRTSEKYLTNWIEKYL